MNSLQFFRFPDMYVHSICPSVDRISHRTFVGLEISREISCSLDGIMNRKVQKSKAIRLFLSGRDCCSSHNDEKNHDIQICFHRSMKSNEEKFLTFTITSEISILYDLSRSMVSHGIAIIDYRYLHLLQTPPSPFCHLK